MKRLSSVGQGHRWTGLNEKRTKYPINGNTIVDIFKIISPTVVTILMMIILIRIAFWFQIKIDK